MSDNLVVEAASFLWNVLIVSDNLGIDGQFFLRDGLWCVDSHRFSIENDLGGVEGHGRWDRLDGFFVCRYLTAQADESELVCGKTFGSPRIDALAFRGAGRTGQERRSHPVSIVVVAVEVLRGAGDGCAGLGWWCNLAGLTSLVVLGELQMRPRTSARGVGVGNRCDGLIFIVFLVTVDRDLVASRGSWCLRSRQAVEFIELPPTLLFGLGGFLCLLLLCKRNELVLGRCERDTEDLHKQTGKHPRQPAQDQGGSLDGRCDSRREEEEEAEEGEG